MRKFPEVAAHADGSIRITSPSGRQIGEVRHARHSRLPRFGWLLDGDETLYRTPTGAIMAAVWRYNHERFAR